MAAALRAECWLPARLLVGASASVANSAALRLWLAGLMYARKPPASTCNPAPRIRPISITPKVAKREHIPSREGGPGAGMFLRGSLAQ